ncbi:sigma-70 family RNA polymerase sigma factor [candidate division KSB1 bacterium]|nr:sigma-70 family RNA polymerase sigma factor [candidate division KSB1 bacterium]
MDYSTLTNNELIRFCANNPENRVAWAEFYKRFDHTIWLVVHRNCTEKNISKNSEQFKLIVQDLVQDVYKKLVDKECKALKEYTGATEKSIYLYLGRICKNEVINYITASKAQKRPQITEYLSDDKEKRNANESEGTAADQPDEQLNLDALKHKIDIILNKYLTGKNKDRDKVIFKLYFYQELSPKEIVSNYFRNLSSKRVDNILSEIRRTLREKLIS